MKTNIEIMMGLPNRKLKWITIGDALSYTDVCGANRSLWDKLGQDSLAYSCGL